MPTLTPTMKLTRREAPSRFPALQNLAFSVEVPADFHTPALPPAEPKFEDPTFVMPLWVASSSVALAVVAVAARPAYDNGTVSEWLGYLAREQGLTLTDLQLVTLGGKHAAIMANAEQTQEDTQLKLRFAAFEDGGYLFIVNVMAPAELWPSFGAVLEAAIASVRLTNPLGATRAVTTTPSSS